MYVKIYSQVFDSSLAEDYQTRHVFMDLLVLADPEGEVDMTHEAIARRTNVPIAIIRDAIGKLTVSDVNSRSKDHEGKRLIPIDPERNWGWKIVNFRHYRTIKNEVARREYMRTYMAKKRAAERAVSKAVSTGKQNVNISSISINKKEEKEERIAPPPATGNAALQQEVAMLVGQFAAVAHQPTTTTFDNDTMRGLLKYHSTDKISDAIRTGIKPGHRIFDLQDILQPRPQKEKPQERDPYAHAKMIDCSVPAKGSTDKVKE